MNALDDICTPEITAKRLENAYSTSSSHAFTVLSVIHDHLCKMLIAAPPGIGFFAYSQLITTLLSRTETTAQRYLW